MEFKKATKTAAKLRLALVGPPGAGKTWTSLLLARALGGRVALVDTERGSASKYSDDFDFDTLTLDEFSPQNYVKAIRAAAGAGFGVLVIDSLSHAWIGKGGALEMHDHAVDRQKTKNTYTAWRDVTPHHNALVDAIIQAPFHVIATMRTKVDYVQEKDERGKTTVRKVGLAPIQRDGLEYEFDVVADMDSDNTIVVGKTRCPALRAATARLPDAEFFAPLVSWLGGQPARAAQQQRPAEPPQKPNGKQPPEAPETVGALAIRLDRWAAAQGLCQPGELTAHLRETFAEQPDGLHEWPESVREEVEAEVKAFVDGARRAKAARQMAQTSQED